MNHENSQNKKNTSRSQLRKGDRPWGGAEAKRRQPASEAMQATLGEIRELMNKNHIRGRHGGVSWHNAAKPVGLVVEVNVAVVRRRTASLPGEISAARGRASGSAGRSNALGDGREVSRGHSNGDVNRGAGKRPIKRRNPQARPAKGRTDTMGRPGHPSHVVASDRRIRRGIGAGQRKRAHAQTPLFRKERRRTFVASEGGDR